jgi:hypothetical protein
LQGSIPHIDSGFGILPTELQTIPDMNQALVAFEDFEKLHIRPGTIAGVVEVPNSAGTRDLIRS